MRKKNDLEKKIEDAFTNTMKRIASKVSYDIETEYEKVISDFYDSYTPYSYERTESTYYASDHFSPFGGYNGFTKGKKNDDSNVDIMSTAGKSSKYEEIINGKSYLSGIKVSSDNIPGHPYRADTDWVFERTFVKGYHGYTLGEATKRRNNYMYESKKLRGQKNEDGSKKHMKYKFSFFYKMNKGNRMDIKIRPQKELKKRLKKKGMINEASMANKNEYVGKMFNNYMFEELSKILK